MKSLRITLALLGAASLAACSGNSQASATKTTAPPQGTATSIGAAPNQDFVNEVTTAGLKEVEISQLAEQKATNPDVKAFAERLVRDHQQANDKLREVLSQTSVQAKPATDDIQDAKDKLDDLSGAKFDKAYMDMMVSDHQKAVNLLQSKIDGYGNAQVKEWATNTLPTIREHYQRAQDIQRSLSGQ